MPLRLEPEVQKSERGILLGLMDFGITRSVSLKPEVYQKIGELKVPKNQTFVWGTTENGKGEPFYLRLDDNQENQIHGIVRLKVKTAAGKETIVMEARTEALSVNPTSKNAFRLKEQGPIAKAGDSLIIEFCPDTKTVISSRASNSGMAIPIASASNTMISAPVKAYASNTYMSAPVKINANASSTSMSVPVNVNASNTMISAPVKAYASNTYMSAPVKKRKEN